MTKASDDRVRRLLDEKIETTMPKAMVLNIENCIGQALSGKISQMEIFIGLSSTQGKKVRLAVIPDELIVAHENQEECSFTVPRVIGEMREVRNNVDAG